MYFLQLDPFLSPPFEDIIILGVEIFLVLFITRRMPGKCLCFLTLNESLQINPFETS